MVLTVTETGFGRLSPIEDYRLQKRGGKGLLNYHVDKFGAVAGVKLVSPEEEDVILISSDGVIIRIPAVEIRQCARPSKGVRVMKVQEDSQVVTLASAPKEEELDDLEELEEETQQEEPGDTPESHGETPDQEENGTSEEDND